MTEELNEHNFDRMVDGELSDQERSRLLHACEDDPAHWRSLALAFIEAQTWRSDFLSLGDEFQQPEPTATPSSLVKHRLPMRRMLNVAAMLLLSLTVGYGIGALSFPNSTDDRSPQLVSQEKPGTATPGNDEQILVLVQNQQTAELQPMKVPLFNIADINTNLTGNSRIPREVLRSLQRKGHDMSHRRRWYPVRLKDGRSALAPIDDFPMLFDGLQ